MKKFQHPNNSPCSHGEHELLDAALFPQQSNSCECELFEELNHFRRKIEQGRSGLHQFPYTIHKNKVSMYQMVFIMLSVIFFAAAIHLYFAHFNWIYYLMFSGTITLQSFLITISCGMGIATGGMGLSLKPEGEIADYSLRRAHRKIKKIYRRKVRFSHCAHYSSPKGMCTLRQGNTLIYEDLIDKLHSLKEENNMTLKRIRLSKKLSDQQKENLYNQAILELQFKLERLVSAYKSNQLLPEGVYRLNPVS
jgi:hypothetical protein